MTAAAFLPLFSDLYSWLIGLNLPLGGILVGVALGALVYAVFEAFRHHATTDSSGTVPITIVEPRREDLRTEPESAPVDAGTATVRVYRPNQTEAVRMRGAGTHPALPLPRARAFVIALVVTFAIVAAILLFFYSFLFARYDRLVANFGAFLYWPLPWPGVFTVSVATAVVPDFIFPMYLAGMAAFAVATGLFYRRPPLPLRRRLLALTVVAVYVLLELVIDALFFTVPGATLRDFALLVRAFTGGLFLALLFFCTVFLPIPQRLNPRFARDRTAIGRFFGVGILAVGLSTIALLGVVFLLDLHGLIFVFTLLLLLPITALTVFATLSRPLYFRQMRRRPLPPLDAFHPAVSIIVPAYNEEEWIEEAIHRADRAASGYPGPVEIIVGNDGSTDHTLDLARGAIARLQHASGVVVDLPHGGKSNALNGALAVATGDIVIRCDGDTFISEYPGFAALIPHFADPRVGGVQGAILPRQRDGWTRKLRALEIAWNHYFLRPAGMGTRSAEVIDGLFSAFRRKDLVDIGGYVPWNGEDTEISIRLQRLGYEVRIEFAALAYEDVPEDYDSLRRQRVRWARGIIMANGQHYPALVGPTPEFAGLAVFFWLLMFIRSGVRSLVYLYLALLIIVLGVPALLDTAVLFALAVGIRALPLAVFLSRMGRRDALLWIPFFPIGNVIKQTFRFEAFGLLGPRALQEYV